MYTLETLSKINRSFISAHYELLQMDVDRVNTCVKRIEKSRTPKKPMPGDIVRYTDELGYYHPHAYIEKIRGDQAHICISAGVYCYPDDEKENGSLPFRRSFGNIDAGRMREKQRRKQR